MHPNGRADGVRGADAGAATVARRCALGARTALVRTRLRANRRTM